MVLAQGEPTYIRALQLSPKQVDTLLVDMHRELTTYHPFAYRADGRQRLDSVLVETRRLLRILYPYQADSLDAAAAIEFGAAFSDVLQDGHTQLRVKRSKAYEATVSAHRYNMSARRLTDSSFVFIEDLMVGDSVVANKGAIFESLEGLPADALISRISTFIGLDDHGAPAAREYFPSLYPALFFQRLYGWRDSLHVGLTDSLGTRQVILYPEAQSDTEKPSRRKLKRLRLNSAIDLDTTRLANVKLLKIRTFSDGAYKGVNEYKHIRQVFDTIVQSNTSGLIIDLRNNTGGSISFMGHVLNHLLDTPYQYISEMVGYHPRARGSNTFAKIAARIFGGVKRMPDGSYINERALKIQKPVKPKRRYTGDLVVLINETSFSGATQFAHLIQSHGRGTVVGQPAGGSAERMYAGRSMKRDVGPQDKFELTLPLFYLDMTGDARGNVIPDVLVERTLDDVLQERDAAYELALEMLDEGE